jgi:two-component system chemotaxis sensor kinase CheA
MPSDSFLRQLRATFVVEAGEHLQTLSDGLLRLERLEGQADAALRAKLMEAVFRAAHSLKGAASAVELGDIEGLCQLLEDVLARQRRDEKPLSAGALDVLHRALDAIRSLLAALGGEAQAVAPTALSALRKDLRRLAAGSPPDALGAGTAQQPAALTPEVHPPAVAATVRPAATFKGEADAVTEAAATRAPVAAASSDSTVRVALAKLEAQLRDTEELLAAKLAASRRVAELQELTASLTTWRKAWAGVEAEVRVLRHLQSSSGAAHAASGAEPTIARLLECCDRGMAASRIMEEHLSKAGQAARRDREALARSVNRALQGAKQLLLLPFSTITAAFPKLVRDLSRAAGKECDLSVTGDHIELDKRILEEVKDPLLHLLRNAVGHGVEEPAERARCGKPQRAVIELAVSQLDGNHVQILLSDDGAGIATERLRRAAVERGLMGQEEVNQLDESGAQALVFRPTLSTDAVATSLSGRGLGLAIVQEHVQRLHGEVFVESEPGRGTRFRIVLPALRATFRGVLCEAAGRRLLMPVATIERVVRVRRDDVRKVEGRETVLIGERLIALVKLADVLELPRVPASAEQPALQVIVLGGAEQAIGFIVDGIHGEEEFLVKPLRKPLIRVRNIAAAAVLGSGTVVPILNAGDLLRSARRAPNRPAASTQPSAPERPTARSILVAEDSITSRLLLKSVLESAGYIVRTAVDGVEALTLLRSEPFDLLVTDVEMPRLNGFDLTARIRADTKLADLPVILVTALATREDKEHGIDVGANAYIVKGGFDRDNLLETVQRLI